MAQQAEVPTGRCPNRSAAPSSAGQVDPGGAITIFPQTLLSTDPALAQGDGGLPPPAGASSIDRPGRPGGRGLSYEPWGLPPPAENERARERGASYGNPETYVQYHTESRSEIDTASTTATPGHSQLATRVMSPNNPTDAGTSSLQMMPWGARGTTYACDVCTYTCHDVVVCAFCQTAGHDTCLQAQYLEHYAFCHQCYGNALRQYEQARAQEARDRWTQRLSLQLYGWRSTMISTAGSMSSVGLALGGAGAVVLGGAAALIRGAVQGASTAQLQNQPALPVEDQGEPAARARGDPCPALLGGTSPPEPEPVSEVPSPPQPHAQPVTRRASSTPRERPTSLSLRTLEGARSELRSATHCRACHRGIDVPHTRKGDCLLQPLSMRLTHRSGHCLTCHEGGHRAHLRYGDCRLAPAPPSTPPAPIAQSGSVPTSGGREPPLRDSEQDVDGQADSVYGAQAGNTVSLDAQVSTEAGDAQTRMVNSQPSGSGPVPDPFRLGPTVVGQRPGQQRTLSDSPRDEREIMDELANALDTQVVSGAAPGSARLAPAGPQIPGSFQSLADEVSSHHSPTTNPPEDLLKAWQQVMVKLESLHQDVLHYTQRTGDTENHVAALFAELAETRDQVAGIDGRLAALEAQAQAWQDSHQDQQDWWAEQEQRPVEQMHPPQHASPHFQIGSEGNSTPRANGEEEIDLRPASGLTEPAATGVEQRQPLHVSVNQSGTAPAGNTSWLNSGGLAVGLDSPGSAGVVTGSVPSGSIDLRRQLDANLAASFLPSFLRSGLHATTGGVTDPNNLHETGAGTDHSRPGQSSSMAPTQGGMMPVAGHQTPPPSFGWHQPGISHEQCTAPRYLQALVTPQGAASHSTPGNAAAPIHGSGPAPDPFRLGLTGCGQQGPPSVQDAGAFGSPNTLQGESNLEEELSHTEVNLLIKLLHSLAELPVLMNADGQTRGEKLSSWRAAIRMHLRTTRTVVLDWWSWVTAVSESNYRAWISSPLHLRAQSTRVQERLPPRYQYIDSWFLPRFLPLVPPRARDLFTAEQNLGLAGRVVDLLFTMLTVWRPDSIEDKQTTLQMLVSPNPCREPSAALKELRRWQQSLARAVELGLALPGVDQLYVGCRSIFLAVFKEGEMDLLMRFTALESSHGAPHVLTQQGLSALIQFAESELTAIQVRGKHGQNTSLPLTDTQKQRLKDEQKKTAEKRAAKAQALGAGQPPPGPGSALVGECATAAGAVAGKGKGQGRSSTTSAWAKPCSFWTGPSGTCSRGISCAFQHAGFATHNSDGTLVQRCVTCGSSAHLSRDCTCPGGAKDPNYDESWSNYRRRRDENYAANPKGPKSKGKGNDSGANTTPTKGDGKKGKSGKRANPLMGGPCPALPGGATLAQAEHRGSSSPDPRSCLRPKLRLSQSVQRAWTLGPMSICGTSTRTTQIGRSLCS